MKMWRLPCELVGGNIADFRDHNMLIYGYTIRYFDHFRPSILSVNDFRISYSMIGRPPFQTLLPSPPPRPTPNSCSPPLTWPPPAQRKRRTERSCSVVQYRWRWSRRGPSGLLQSRGGGRSGVRMHPPRTLYNLTDPGRPRDYLIWYCNLYWPRVRRIYVRRIYAVL